MKTLLTIGGSTMLLPVNTDPAAILKLLVGAKIVRDQYHYTKDTKEHPSGRYVSASVITELQRDRITVACVPDEDVLTEGEWQARVEAENALASKETPLPAAVG